MRSEVELTRLLTAAADQAEGAMDRLMEAVYDDLHAMAERHFRAAFRGRTEAVTLEPAALVNETYLKLIRQNARYENRGHFFAMATKLMLRVLIDYQRSRSAVKRRRAENGERITLSLLSGDDDGGQAADSNVIGVEQFEMLLARLDSLDARKADVVRMRIIWSMPMQQVSESLGVSLATVERDWTFSKAWLRCEIEADEAAGGRNHEGRSCDLPRVSK